MQVHFSCVLFCLVLADSPQANATASSAQECYGAGSIQDVSFRATKPPAKPLNRCKKPPKASAKGVRPGRLGRIRTPPLGRPGRTPRRLRGGEKGEDGEDEERSSLSSIQIHPDFPMVCKNT